MHIETIEVTPTTAADWLKTDASNRHRRDVLVARYAGAMQRGEWVLNGETIKFSPDGSLMDGQHRLAAVVRAEVTVPMLIAWDVPEAARVTMDTGAKRTLGDVLRMRGETEPMHLAATLTLLYRLEHDREASGDQPTTVEALDVLDRHPTIRASVRAANWVYRRVPLRQSIGSVCHYDFKRLSEADAEEFINRLANGTELEEGNPILTLRRLLERVSRRDIPGYSPQRLQAFVVKAWNRWREGEQLQVLRWRPSGNPDEPFPKAH